MSISLQCLVLQMCLKYPEHAEFLVLMLWDVFQSFPRTAGALSNPAGVAQGPQKKKKKKMHEDA